MPTLIFQCLWKDVWRLRHRMRSALALAVACLVALPVQTRAEARPDVIRAAGSSFPAPLYASWSGIYEKQTGVRIQYDAIGTTPAFEALSKGQAAFIAANRPLGSARVEKEALLQFPMVMGGVVPVVRIFGVGPGEMRLTGPVLADIFMGKITQWTDSAIRRLNPSVRLPAGPINVISRKDASGTTFLLSSYLNMVSADWKAEVSSAPFVAIPVGYKADGLNNLILAMQRLPNSIAYVDYGSAKRLKLSHVLVQNASGRFVGPTYRSIQAAALGGEWKGTMSVVTTNSPHPHAWPIASPSFVLARTSYLSNEESANAQRALEFLAWAMRLGDQIADDLDFVPLPQEVKARVEREVSARLTALSGDGN